MIVAVNAVIVSDRRSEVLNFFQASLRNCINCVHCDDHFFIFTLSIYPVPGIEPVNVPALQSSALATDLNLINPAAANVLVS